MALPMQCNLNLASRLSASRPKPMPFRSILVALTLTLVAETSIARMTIKLPPEKRLNPTEASAHGIAYELTYSEHDQVVAVGHEHGKDMAVDYSRVSVGVSDPRLCPDAELLFVLMDGAVDGLLPATIVEAKLGEQGYSVLLRKDLFESSILSVSCAGKIPDGERPSFQLQLIWPEHRP